MNEQRAIDNPLNRPRNPFTSVLNLFRRPRQVENPNVPLSTALILREQRGNLSPIDTSPDYGALRYSAVFACERAITETIASLPLEIYKRDGENKETALDHPLWQLLTCRPNDYQTPFIFWDYVIKCAIRLGNAYVYIERTNANNVANLVPLDPKLVRVVIENGEKVFYYNNGEYRLNSDDVLHFVGFSKDGIIGLPIAEYAQNAISLGLAAEAFALRYFSKGSNPAQVFGTDTTLTQAQFDQVKAALSAYEGIDNAGKSLVLPYGVKPLMDSSNKAAELMEIRKFQLQEVARCFKIPQHMAGDLDRGTFSNIEHQSIEFVQNSIRPWLVQFEQQLNMKLFDYGVDYFCQFNLDEIERGDRQSRYNAYHLALTDGWMTVNDVRREEGLPEIDGGDELRVPLNMGTPDSGDGATKAEEPDGDEEDDNNPEDTGEDNAK